MAKLIEYDVTGVEESGGGTGVKVKPGVKVARIEICEKRDTKTDGSPANDLRIALNVGEEFDWVYTYIGLSEAAAWKMKEFIKAVGLKDKGKLDPDKMKGKIIRVKINSGEYEGEYSPRVGKLFPAQPGDELGSASEISTARATGPDTDDSEPEAAADPNAFQPTREDPNDEEVGSYDDWTDDDITAEVEDRGLTLPGGRGKARDKGIKALRADDETAAGDDAAEPAADGTGAGDEYDDWSTDDLKAEWDERQMGDLPSIRGRNAEDRLRTAIIEELRKDDTENPFEG